MKFRLTNLLALFLVLVCLASCAGNSTFEKSVNVDDADIYPSQFLTGDVYILKDGEKIDGNIAGIGTTLVIEEGAQVKGDISLIASNLEVDGKVNGDINLFAGTSTFNDNAIVTGTINQIFNQIEASPNASIYGEINTYIFPASGDDTFGQGLPNLLEWANPTALFSFQAARVISLLLLSLLAISLFHTPTFKVIDSIRQNLAVSWGAGILTLFFIPIIALVLIITICLSPIGILILLAFFISLIWGWTALSFIIGERFTHWLKLDWSNEGTAAVGAVLTGVILSVISLIPCLGFFINTVISAIGLGGVLISRFGTLKA